MSTYVRKYFVHRRIKRAGFRLKLEQKHKTIFIKTGEVEKASANRYVKELQEKHGYGIQIELYP